MPSEEKAKRKPKIKPNYRGSILGIIVFLSVSIFLCTMFWQLASVPYDTGTLMLRGADDNDFISILEGNFPIGMERREVEQIIAAELQPSELGCYTPSSDVICLKINARHLSCEYYYMDIVFSFENNQLSNLNITYVLDCW